MQTSKSQTGLRSAGCRLYLWEEGKVLDDAGTLLVENSDSQQGHASAKVLECQVESSALGQRPETPDFSVHFHQPSAKVDLGETFIGGDCVHLRGGKEQKSRDDNKIQIARSPEVHFLSLCCAVYCMFNKQHESQWDLLTEYCSAKRQITERVEKFHAYRFTTAVIRQSDFKHFNAFKHFGSWTSTSLR